ncbi:MAG: hypothetical protein IIC90_10085 [Chloroflexi bacterium]|nr:hypothetical protein [Chloroflexota bacterium]
MAEEYLVADTGVISYLTKASEHSRAYNELIGERRLAVSFQTPAELAAARFGASRQQQVDDLIAAIVVLPHGEPTNVWYGRVVLRRKELKRGGRAGSDASDADVWIISSALEHSMALLSHDTQQVHLGRAIGLKVLTNLDGLKDDNPSG